MHFFNVKFDFKLYLTSNEAVCITKLFCEPSCIVIGTCLYNSENTIKGLFGHTNRRIRALSRFFCSFLFISLKKKIK